MKNRRLYSEELKSEATKLITEQGLTYEEAGRQLSIPKGTIARWISEAKKQPAVPGTPSQKRNGEDVKLFEQRNQTIQKAKEKNPLRWGSRKVRSWKPCNTVVLNPGKKVRADQNPYE
ncbi:MAG TPA: hypothetical protein ENN79_01310, partial [Desulfobacteraceae bacterium]|nr:hypothetical protein [Desulfobacteraceae bacterium]